jgi:hypothetical protein
LKLQVLAGFKGENLETRINYPYEAGANSLILKELKNIGPGLHFVQKGVVSGLKHPVLHISHGSQ